jgi:hypothetical protein
MNFNYVNIRGQMSILQTEILGYSVQVDYNMKV